MNFLNYATIDSEAEKTCGGIMNYELLGNYMSE